MKNVFLVYTASCNHVKEHLEGATETIDKAYEMCQEIAKRDNFDLSVNQKLLLDRIRQTQGCKVELMIEELTIGELVFKTSL